MTNTLNSAQIEQLHKERTQLDLLAQNPDWVSVAHSIDVAEFKAQGGKFFDREGVLHNVDSVPEGEEYLWVLPNPWRSKYKAMKLERDALREALRPVTSDEWSMNYSIRAMQDGPRDAVNDLLRNRLIASGAIKPLEKDSQDE